MECDVLSISLRTLIFVLRSCLNRYVYYSCYNLEITFAFSSSFLFKKLLFSVNNVIFKASPFSCET